MQRESNIELCRIASIICVLLVHSGFLYMGWPTSLADTSLGLILLESFTIIGVNVFVFISGWFSIKLKPQTILNLIFYCFFYFVILSSINFICGKEFVRSSIFFVSNSNWFIMDYLGLVLVSPILNKFIENIDKKSFAYLLILLFAYSFWSGWMPFACAVNRGEFSNGYSILSFCQLYLLARYFALHGAPKLLKNNGFVIYMLVSLLLAGLEYLALRFSIERVMGVLYNYNNPLVILSAVAFFFGFQKMQMPNLRAVNHIAKSCLGVLLFHNSYPLSVPVVESFLKGYYNNVYVEYSGFSVVGLWIVGIVGTFVVAVSIDQIRLFLFNKIVLSSRVTKFLFYVEGRNNHERSE